MYTHTHTHSIIPLRSPARHYLHLPARAIHARTASTIAPVTVQACINNDFAAYKRAFQLCAKEVEKGKAEQITNEMKDLQPFWGLRQARPPPPLLRRHTTTASRRSDPRALNQTLGTVVTAETAVTAVTASPDPSAPIWRRCSSGDAPWPRRRRGLYPPHNLDSRSTRWIARSSGPAARVEASGYGGYSGYGSES